jgi:hypothetical protein
MLGHAREYLSYLRGGLSGSEDHLGHACAQGAVMIELGESDIFEGQVAETVEGVSDGGSAFAHFIQQRLDLSAIHQISFAAWLAAPVSLAA